MRNSDLYKAKQLYIKLLRNSMSMKQTSITYNTSQHESNKGDNNMPTQATTEIPSGPDPMSMHPGKILCGSLAFRRWNKQAPSCDPCAIHGDIPHARSHYNNQSGTHSENTSGTSSNNS